MIEFQLNNFTKLGFIPEKSIKNIVSNTIPNPNLANEIPKCELYLFVDNVTKTLKKTIKLGAKEINLPKKQRWK